MSKNVRFKELLVKYNLPFKTYWIDYEGYKIQAYKFGDNEENVTFCIPSFPFSGLFYHWILYNASKTGCTFITFDVPGWIGYSENYFKHRRFSMDALLDIACKVIDHFNPPTFKIIGYSFGGVVAMRLTDKYAERVKKLALVSTLVNANHTKYYSLPLLARIINRLQMFSVIKYYIKEGVVKMEAIARKRNMAEEYLRIFDEMFENCDAKVLSDSIYDFFHLDYREYLLKVSSKNIPIILVNSDDDFNFLKKQGKLMRDLLKDVKYTTLHGDHNSFVINGDSLKVKNLIRRIVED